MVVDRGRVAQALEREIVRLPGVRGARVEPGEPISSVRVLVVPELTTQDALDDCFSVAASLGVSLERDAIQVLGSSEFGSNRRRRLAVLQVRRNGDRFSVQATLELEGDSLVGEVNAPRGPRFENRAVARAVLDALKALLRIPLQLETVELMPVGAERFAVVTLSTQSDSLVGSAIVRFDEFDAVARATLDSVNRLLDLSHQRKD